MTIPAPDGARDKLVPDERAGTHPFDAAVWKADLAHEIRTPLQIVATSIEILQKTGKLDPALLERMKTASSQIAALVGIADGSPSGAEEPTSSWPTEDVRIAIDWLNATAAQPTILFSEKNRSRIRVRPSQLRRLVLNLVENARAAIRESGVGSMVAVTCNDRFDADGRAIVEILVEDDGPGIPAAIVDRLFEKGATTRSANGGSGRGLAFCKDIVAEEGGRLTLDPTRSTGTAFKIEFPAQKVESSEPPATARSSTPVLLVDDDMNLVTTYRMILELDGYDVEVETTGAKAVEKLVSGAYGAALVDLHLKDLSGQEVLEEVARRHPKMARRIVFATGDAAAQRSRNFLERCGNLYLLKPFSIDDLKRAFAALGIVGSTS
jgi:CheY-like chemotaxis protein